MARLTLNRPERHNALDDATIAVLTEVLQRIGGDPSVRVVVLAGAGKSFCAGADLDWMRRMARFSHEENLADANRLAALIHALDTLPKPTLALVQGGAFGGGVGLVCACDVAIGSEAATFRLSEVRLGLTPATISPVVVRAIGARQARRYFLTAETIDAATARNIGLLHDVAPSAELDAATDRMIDALLSGAPVAQHKAKMLVQLCEAESNSETLLAETARRIAERRASEEAREGMAAFFERRPPIWPAG